VKDEKPWSFTDQKTLLSGAVKKRTGSKNWPCPAIRDPASSKSVMNQSRHSDSEKSRSNSATLKRRKYIKSRRYSVKEPKIRTQRTLLQKLCTALGGQQRTAEQLGFTQVKVSRLLSGKTPINDVDAGKIHLEADRK
jgi:hypothetical protein